MRIWEPWKPLETVDEHRAVLLSEDVFSDLDDQVRAHAHTDLSPGHHSSNGQLHRGSMVDNLDLEISVGRTESRGGMVS